MTLTAPAPLRPRLAAAAALALLAAAPLPAAHAQMHTLGAKLGTTGPGIEYAYSAAAFPKYALRANFNYGTFSRDTTRSDVLYEGTIHFRSLLLTADAQPFANGFRLSAGFLYNKNELRGRGTPLGATVNINGTAYPSDQVGNLRGELFFQPISPYFGVGWGGAPRGQSGVFYSFDFGVAYQRPDLRLNAECGPALPPATCAELQADLEAEAREFRRDLFDGRLFPVLSFGLGYRF